MMWGPHNPPIKLDWEPTTFFTYRSPIPIYLGLFCEHLWKICPLGSHKLNHLLFQVFMFTYGIWFVGFLICKALEGEWLRLVGLHLMIFLSDNSHKIYKTLLTYHEGKYKTTTWSSFIKIILANFQIVYLALWSRPIYPLQTKLMRGMQTHMGFHDSIWVNISWDKYIYLCVSSHMTDIFSIYWGSLHSYIICILSMKYITLKDPDQDAPFFYTWSYLIETPSCRSIISTNFLFFSFLIFK